MYCDSPEEATDFPSAGSDSSSPAFQAIYWRCVCVFFQTARHFNPDAQLILFTNINDLPTINRFSVSIFLRNIGVRCITLNRAFLLPAGFTSSFGNCFFKLDCIKYFSDHPQVQETAVLILDNDIAVTESLARLSELVLAKRYLFYDVDHAEYNGLRMDEIVRIFAEESEKASAVTGVTLGGEFVGFASSAGSELIGAIETAFTLALRRFQEGKSFLSTEEHIYAYANLMLKFGVLSATDNPYIKRIWTGRFNNQAPSDIGLALWHLPREKRYGFKRLFERIERGGEWSKLMSKESIGAAMGLPRASLRKKLGDAIDYLQIRVHDGIAG